MPAIESGMAGIRFETSSVFTSATK